MMMIKAFCIGFLYLLGYVSCSYAQPSGWTKLEDKPILRHVVNDTLAFDIFLVKGSVETDLYYAAFLQTNVCNDQLCLPIEVNLFWDLLGTYHHFTLPDSHHFTKFDHAYFEPHDYEKLDAILKDSLSLLRDYQVIDLLDNTATQYSLEVDAVTRPTSVLFSDATVPGALYTVYTLWHIVNGNINRELAQYLQQHYQSKGWASLFAASDQAVYQQYFLDHLLPEDIDQYRGQVVHLLYVKDDYVPHAAIRILGDTFWHDPLQYNPMIAQAKQLKPHVLSVILQRLAQPNSDAKHLLKELFAWDKLLPKQRERIEQLLANGD